ncbi:MAG: N-6 DNA methylase, partial [Planctomycetota bacterium]|nr:N-6 DNA methylase [Planctomycetota bacterium]
MESYISVATLRNWDRLNVTDAGKKLTKRANKTHSARTILPTEYVTDSNNIPAVEQIIEIVGASDATIPTAMYSLALNLLRQRKLLSGASSNPTNVDAFIKEYEYLGNDANLRQLLLPDNENDILGLVYQSLLLEGTKNQQGLYYTPSSIVDSMLRETVVGDRKTVLDPCCGSGSFLRNTQVIDPMQLFGIDIDPVAVML